MKFAGFSRLLLQISRFGSRNDFHSKFYSTKVMPSRTFIKSPEGPTTELYLRISPVFDRNISIVPILDQWIEQGRSVDKQALIYIQRKLRDSKRYNHALQISMWMIDKRYSKLTSSGVAIQLNLIAKVHGIEQAENYFKSIPQELRGFQVYGALLYNFAAAKCVEKAEAVMQKMNDLGSANRTLQYNTKLNLYYKTGNMEKFNDLLQKMEGNGIVRNRTIQYNTMLNLYYKTGNMEKFNDLLHKMEENGIVRNSFTLSIQLSAYAADMDIEKMDKILTIMESDPKGFDWTSYTAAAAGYRKAGLLDKALEMLKKAEASLMNKPDFMAYSHLLTHYANIGRKDEVLRIWSLYKKKSKVPNKGYSHFLNSLVTLGDFEMAEEIFNEWESRDDLTYDINMANIMIGSYSRKGLIEKAEAYVDREISKGGIPNAWTWYHMVEGYLKTEQPQKAVEMMKKTIVMLSGIEWEPVPEVPRLKACLEYLKGVGDTEQIEEFVKLLVAKEINSLDKLEELFLDKDERLSQG